MNQYHRYVLAPLLTAGIIGLVANQAEALSITPIDLNSIQLGEKIVGPVGPTVETTFINSAGEGVGDLISSVSCPAGFSICAPPTNPADTIYTYIHTVTPGVDNNNDAPFPLPSVILPLDGTREFSLGFAAAGFNGVAGFDFGQATKALGAGGGFTIKQLADNRLRWRVNKDTGWDTGETISFFWQTSQAPSGPGGTYNLANPVLSGAANGPLPTPVPVSTDPDVAIPEGPVSLLSTVLALGGLLTFSKFRKKGS